jgi:hypothetical protein
MTHVESADAELGREIEQSDRLARILIERFEGLPAAMVMHALAIVIAYAVERQSTSKDLAGTMALLQEAAQIELDYMRGETE